LTRSIGAAPVFEIAAETPPTVLVSSFNSGFQLNKNLTQEVDSEILQIEVLSQL
jgi:hypothetical protein